MFMRDRTENRMGNSTEHTSRTYNFNSNHGRMRFIYKLQCENQHRLYYTFFCAIKKTSVPLVFFHFQNVYYKFQRACKNETVKTKQANSLWLTMCSMLIADSVCRCTGTWIHWKYIVRIRSRQRNWCVVEFVFVLIPIRFELDCRVVCEWKWA